MKGNDFFKSKRLFNKSISGDFFTVVFKYFYNIYQIQTVSFMCWKISMKKYTSKTSFLRRLKFVVRTPLFCVKNVFSQLKLTIEFFYIQNLWSPSQKLVSLKITRDRCNYNFAKELKGYFYWKNLVWHMFSMICKWS